jgi:NitT/TauT family transport system permease protein
MSMKKRAWKTVRVIAPPALVFIVFVGLLEAIIWGLKVPDYLLPSPHAVAVTIWSKGLMLLKHTAITMGEALAGFVSGGVVGILTAILFVHSHFFERSLYPYAIALKTIPLVALAPLLVLWFGNGIGAKIVMAALICYFPVIVNALKGFRAVSPEATDLMASLSASRSQVFFRLRLPSSLPYIFAALKITSTLSVIGAIVGELAGATQGIGYLILIASYRIQTELVFAAVVASCVGGIAFFLLIGVVEKKVAARFGGGVEPIE